jgi:hypothetical protein
LNANWYESVIYKNNVFSCPSNKVICCPFILSD